MTPTHRTRGPIRAIVLTVLAAGAQALGQTDFVADANLLYSDITRERHGHEVLLPALVELEAPPAGLDDARRAALVQPGMSSWPAADAWAQGPGQRAAIEALMSVTRVEDYRDAVAFVQPYGTRGIPVAIIRAGLYTDLGDPPLLGAARHNYLPRLDRLRSLVHVEASRLTAEGRSAEAGELLFRLALFARQMIDREFMVEAYWGYRVAIEAIARIRDVVYLDFKADRRVNPEKLRALIARLDAEGGLALDRLSFPRADRIAAQQTIEYVYEPRKGVKPSEFVQTMSRLTAAGRPLRRFSAGARWADAAGTQVDWFDITDALTRVHEGWAQRWRLEWDNPVLNLPFPYDEYSDRSKYAAVAVPLQPQKPEGGPLLGQTLFKLRTALEVERVGTRQALAVVGTLYQRGLYPPQLASTRPQWISVIEPDAFRRITLVSGGGSRDMRYFVPVRDDYVTNRRDEKQPHFMEVFPGDGTNFGRELFEEDFVLYSAGANGRDDDGKRVTSDAETEVGDYLIWPPVLGLYRTHLIENGLLD